MTLLLFAAACGHPPTKKVVSATTRPATPMARPTSRATQNHVTDPLTIAELRKGGLHAERIRCNGRVLWVPQLHRLAKEAAAELARRERRPLSKAQHKKNTRVVLGYLVRLVFQVMDTQNLGAMQLRGRSYKDARGQEHPLLIFRSGVTTDVTRKASCLHSLLTAGRVRHVVNLYGGTFPLHEFIRAERQLCEKLGATHHDDAADKRVEWRKLIKTEASYEKNRLLAMKRVAKLINQHILRPHGKPPRGNIYIHCGGGMHRSGMVFGVLRRCINGAEMSRVEREYKRHVAYRSPQRPGGYEALNVRFIREFDCKLLTPPSPATCRSVGG
ncbi:MAG: hypothetical protein CSA65_08505 [Proteobacteria bacterium]|nr:MAG: hypothetical protein CSA65_08505 [Pseudomonadota bacterium]